MLGASIFGAPFPACLSRGMEARVRRVPLGNLLHKGTASLAMHPAAGMSSAMPLPVPFEAGQVLVLVNLLFNASLVVLFIPVIGIVERLLLRMLPDAPPVGDLPGGTKSARP